ncbi:hypothetical protein MY04_4710 [Flammeovirga sp. MY04]|uniref:hypothetical protein n=1 Tax=Flammeovirga sp. MY04 TaxID=1191459 RepID=UPI00080622A5|nr:hypothetical protein [Flammeovirga sp. MY04]ANQ52045.1 hypothetical protein MY04_4710 [Flammeovirga sp. MY04]
MQKFLRNYLHLIVICVLFIPLNLIAKGDPVWLKAEYRLINYPTDKFLTAYQVAVNVTSENKSDRLAQLKLDAKKELAENVSVQIESVSKTEIANASGASYENFKQNSTSFSNVNLSGLHQMDYYDEKKAILYTFIYIEIKELLSINRKRVSEANQKIKTLKNQIDNYIASENIIAAKETIRKVIPIFREVEELYAVSITLGDKIDLNYNEFINYQTEIEKTNKELLNTHISSVDELANDIASIINDQVQLSNQTLRVDNFTFEDTKMGSKLSMKLHALLTSKLSSQSKFRVLDATNATTKFELQGTIWEEGESLRVLSILRDKESGNIQGGSESKILKKKLGDTPFKPDNLDYALKVQGLITSNQSNNQGLSLDVITNKGNKSPIYEKGEIMSLYVKVNRPCKVRFIYHLADGTKVLLLDNYEITAQQVNQMVKVSQEFECYPPFGVETLQVFAKTGSNFKPLSTSEDQGYYFIQDDIETINNVNRQFSDLEQEVAFSEKRLLITTLPAN